MFIFTRPPQPPPSRGATGVGIPASRHHRTCTGRRACVKRDLSVNRECRNGTGQRWRRWIVKILIPKRKSGEIGRKLFTGRKNTRFDRRDILRFGARQSPAGASLLQRIGLPAFGVGSIILVEHSVVKLRCAAVLRMMSLLGFPFSLAAVFRVVPIRLRDALYDLACPKSLEMVRPSDVPHAIGCRASSLPLTSSIAADFLRASLSLIEPDKPDKSSVSY